MEKKTPMTVAFNMLLIIVVLLLGSVITYEIHKSNETEIELPEEIALAVPGDKLMVTWNADNKVIIEYDMQYHVCNWEDCEHKGELMNAERFVSLWGYEEDTDGYLVELTHYMNPEMTYEQTEAYVFSGME